MAAALVYAAMLCGLATAARAGDSTSWQPIALRFGVQPGATRLVLDLPAAPGVARLSSSADLTTLTLSQPQGAEPAEGAGRGLVRRWRIDATGAEVHINIGLAPGAAVRRRFAIAPQALGAPWRYVVDIVGQAAAPETPVIQAVANPAEALERVPTNGSRVSEQNPRQSEKLANRYDPIGSNRYRAPGLVLAAPLVAARSAPPLSLAQIDPGPLDQTGPQLASARGADHPPTPTDLARPALHPAQRGNFVASKERKIVVIDAGHGGRDVGARGGSSDEKDLNLAAALALKARLERTGRYRIVLTRGDDTFVALDERVRIARRAHADLFISLHSDSAGVDGGPHGASVYTLSDSGVSRVRTVLAPDDALSRAGGPKAARGVNQILIDLSQRSTRNRSAEFASVLLDRIGHTVDLLPRSHRDAGYFVLLAPDVPAVLLEMGFVTNPDDEARLASREQRHAFMDRVGDAIDDYFAPPRQVAAATS